MSLIEIPGAIDPHVHLREPGGVHKEGFVTGTKAAIAGGVTMVLDMPNNPVPISTGERLTDKVRMAEGRVYADVGFHFIGTEGSIADMDQVRPFVSGLKVYMNETTGNFLEEDPEKLRRIFEGWKNPQPIIVHAEGEKLRESIQLARELDRRLHVAHVSLAQEVEMIKVAKEDGMRITAEVTPHHLFLTEDMAHHLGSYGEMKPPLGRQQDVYALWGGLRNGVIDLVATDHAPHTKEEKSGPNPPSGVPGLETTLRLLVDAMGNGRLDLDTLVRVTSKRAWEIFGLPKSDATVLIDTSRPQTITHKNMYSKCGWTPFEGWEVRGSIIKVTLRGEIVFDGEQVVGPPNGKMIRPDFR